MKRLHAEEPCLASLLLLQTVPRCSSSPRHMKRLHAKERRLASLLLLMQLGWLSLGTCAKMRVIQKVFSAAEWCMEMAFRDARNAWTLACARRVEAASRAMAPEEVWPMPPGCKMAPTRANSRWAWSNWTGEHADPQAPPGADETPMAPSDGAKTPVQRASSPLPPGWPPPCPPLEPLPAVWPPEDGPYDCLSHPNPETGMWRIIHDHGLAANCMAGYRF